MCCSINVTLRIAAIVVPSWNLMKKQISEPHSRLTECNKIEFEKSLRMLTFINHCCHVTPIISVSNVAFKLLEDSSTAGKHSVY